MSRDLKDQHNDTDKVEIKLNRKMRSWNKYKNYVIIGGGILVLVIVMILILRGCNSGSDSKEKESEAQTTTHAIEGTPQTTTEATTEATTQQQTTTAVPSGGSYKVDGSAVEQDFTAKDSLKDSIFIGDSITSGFAYYGYIGDGQVLHDTNMTSDDLSDYTDQVVAANPDKVFIMVGLNDLNYGTRGTDAIAQYISSFTSDLAGKLPSAKIYVLSVLPVTADFESSANVNITQSGIDELNTKLASGISGNISYIDVASAFKAGNGYMDSSYTGNGNNIYNEYYPFLLNGIAGAAK